MNFDERKNDYSDIMGRSLRFTGKNHDYFTRGKASIIQKIVHEELRQEIRSRVRVLDIGCGHGFIHHYLQDYDITGLDTAGSVLELAQHANNGVNYVHCDGGDLPFQSGSFDVILMICVIHHVAKEEWSYFLKEVRRVLGLSGFVIIFEHNPFNPITRYIVKKNPLDVGANLISSSCLREQLFDTGFAGVKSRYISLTPFALPIFGAVEKMLNKIPLGAQYYTIAQGSGC